MKKTMSYRVQEFLADHTKGVQYPKPTPIRTIQVKPAPHMGIAQAGALICIGMMVLVAGAACVGFAFMLFSAMFA